MTTFRADKTTRNSDDGKVLLAGAIFAIFLMVAAPFLQKMYDVFLSPRPFITATLEIIPNGTDEPFILYDADANQPVEGTWIASLKDESGTMLASRYGHGVYNDLPDDARKWTFFAFFDNEKGLNSPGVPNIPFQVCVRYSVEARDSGATDETPLYCSAIYTPPGVRS